MARYGRLPVELLEGVSFEQANGKVQIKGPKGTLSKEIPHVLEIKEEDGKLLVVEKKETRQAKILKGTMRSHLQNMVEGVSGGWTKALEIEGPGYRAEVKDDELVLSVGFSHPVIIKAPQDTKFKVEKNLITIEGIDKEMVGQVAAKIRDVRKPNPYKGSGIRYQGEEIRRKPGKQAIGASE